MQEGTTKQVQILQSQLQLLKKPKLFDIRLIQTLGVFSLSDLDSIKEMQIRQQSFKQLITTTLKLCYLYDPILITLHEMQKNDNSFHPNPNNLLKVGSILKVLYQNLFYRNMVKLKLEGPDMVINLVNNRPTQLNRRVIIAALIVFISKKLTIEDIGVSMLIFNLQQALLKLKPYGLPLQLNTLQKCIKKIDRIINLNVLRNFILTTKQQKQYNTIDEQLANQQQTIQYQYLIGPDYFLYLIALSEQKSVYSKIFIQPHDVSKKNISKIQGIELFLKKKKQDSIVNISENRNSTNIQQGKGSLINQKSNAKFRQTEFSYSHHNQNKDDILQKERKMSVEVKRQNHLIRGLSLHNKESDSCKKIKRYQDIYKQIKDYLRNNRAKNSSLTIQHSKEGGNLQKKSIKKMQVWICEEQKKEKPDMLKSEMSKMIRPSSAVFQSSMNLISKSIPIKPSSTTNQTKNAKQRISVPFMFKLANKENYTEQNKYFFNKMVSNEEELVNKPNRSQTAHFFKEKTRKSDNSVIQSNENDKGKGKLFKKGKLNKKQSKTYYVSFSKINECQNLEKKKCSQNPPQSNFHEEVVDF